MNEFNKEIFLKAYSHYNHTLKKKQQCHKNVLHKDPFVTDNLRNVLHDDSFLKLELPCFLQ